MRELVEYLARALVDVPEAVTVEERPGDPTTYELSVAPGDLGKVIGKQGRTAKAMRTLLAARAETEGKRVTLEILD
jgi:predicted RNA-binding protein YlqC (UPF0109 family)